MEPFELDTRLAADTQLVGDMPLCRVLLMNDSRYTWLTLVPRQAGLVEIHDLAEGDQQTLLSETVAVSQYLKQHAQADKMNIGALGNIVTQLHIHIIARNEGDPAWPGPVWGHSPAQAYEPMAQLELLETLRRDLAPLGLVLTG